MTRIVCFLVLPWLPALALALLDADPVPVVRDRIVVIVLAGLVCVLLSAALALRPGHGWPGAALYGATTALLSVGGVALVIALILAGALD
jgi:hypothetical protein